MPMQLRNLSHDTRSSNNQSASHRHSSPPPQKQRTSRTTRNSSIMTKQTTPTPSTQTSAALTPQPIAHPAIAHPAIAKQRQLEDQLSKTVQENLTLVKQNLQLRERDLKLQGQLLVSHSETADLREQLFNLEERSRHIERNACDAAEAHRLELSRFKATVSDGLNESSVRRREVDDKFASDLNAALELRREGLEDCERLVAAAVGDLQEGKFGTNDGVQTAAEQPKEMSQPRRSVFGGISHSDGNHGTCSAGGASVPTAKMVEHEQAAGTAASPRVPDTASKKRGMVAESSGGAALRERGVAKKVKIADQNSPHREDEERFGRTYPAINSLLGKDDVTYEKALEQLGPNNLQGLDDSSREQMKKPGNPEGIVVPCGKSGLEG